jgi:tetratricopeptide (TPR) repeat protein
MISAAMLLPGGAAMCRIKFFTREFLATLAFLMLLCAQPAQAFDPATDHKCVAYCDGGSVPSGGGGGYAAPAPRGPSPAELAAQRQRMAGLAANKRGVTALNRPLGGKDLSSRASELNENYKEAVRYFEEASRFLPQDSNIRLNLANAKGVLAQFEGNNETAIAFFEEALRYSPRNSLVAENLRQARESLASRKRPDQIAFDQNLEKAQAAEKAEDWDAALRYREEGVRLCAALQGTTQNHGCDIDSAFMLYARGRRALAEKDWTTSVEDLRATLDFYSKKFGDNPGFDSLKQWKADIATALAIAEAQQKQQASSNPNYPNPPPVYRDADTPRSYPDFKGYTPQQHAAHEANEDGNLWAQKGEWVQAMLGYQKALTLDPNGQFSDVLKENLAIAMKHLGPAKPQNSPAASPAPSPAPRQARKPEEIATANCTGWMKQTDGTSFRMCMDEQAHSYCEQAAGQGPASRVSCQ